jgi:CDP-diacylglycerol--glycerol-3-phosphate 3-phosphatidyltransferase
MANFITLLRFPLMGAFVALLYLGSPTLILWGVPFLAIIILMDTLDGTIARRRKETSLLGSALDIAADRTLEFFLWVVFAHLRLISIAIPLIVILRGVTVDAFRAVGIAQGVPPFKQVTSPISRFLVSSPWMRSGYGISKGFAFGLLTIDLGLSRLQHPWAGAVHEASLVIAWIAVAFCVARGIPPILEGFRHLGGQDRAQAATSQLDQTQG